MNHKFKVKICGASLKRDVAIMSDMNTYAILEMGKQVEKTLTCEGGGKKPKWNKEFTFKTKDTILRIEVKEASLFQTSIGKGFIDLAEQQLCDEPIQFIVELTHEKKLAGKVPIYVTQLVEENISDSHGIFKCSMAAQEVLSPSTPRQPLQEQNYFPQNSAPLSYNSSYNAYTSLPSQPPNPYSYNPPPPPANYCPSYNSYQNPFPPAQHYQQPPNYGIPQPQYYPPTSNTPTIINLTTNKKKTVR